LKMTMKFTLKRSRKCSWIAIKINLISPKRQSYSEIWHYFICWLKEEIAIPDLPLSQTILKSINSLLRKWWYIYCW
jgi:hypothetical protein